MGIAGFDQSAGPRPRPTPPKPGRRGRGAGRRGGRKERRFRAGQEAGQDSTAWPEPQFHCLKCDQKVKHSRPSVQNHLRKHRLSLQEYLDRYNSFLKKHEFTDQSVLWRFDSAENLERLHRVRQWVQSEEYLTRIQEVADIRRSRSRSSGHLDTREEEEQEEEEEETVEIDTNGDVEEVVTNGESPVEVPVEAPMEAPLGILAVATGENQLEAKDEPLETPVEAGQGTEEREEQGSAPGPEPEPGSGQEAGLQSPKAEPGSFPRPPMDGNLLIAIAVSSFSQVDNNF